MRISLAYALPRIAPATGKTRRPDASVFVAGIVVGEHQAP